MGHMVLHFARVSNLFAEQFHGESLEQIRRAECSAQHGKLEGPIGPRSLTRRSLGTRQQNFPGKNEKLDAPYRCRLYGQRSGGESKFLVANGQFEGDLGLVGVRQLSSHRIGDRYSGTWSMLASAHHISRAVSCDDC